MSASSYPLAMIGGAPTGDRERIPAIGAVTAADLARLINSARVHAVAMRNMTDDEAFDYVEGVIEATPVVIGVFAVSGEPFGAGLQLLKGGRELLPQLTLGGPAGASVGYGRPLS